MLLKILPEDILINALNVLQACFMDGRVKGKRLYRELKQGNICQVAALKHGEEQVIVELEFDKTAYVGSLSFSVFQDYVQRFVLRAKDRILKRESINDFSNELGSEILFHLPSISPKDGAKNVFVISVIQPSEGVMRLVLQFLDPAQFDQKEQA